MKEYSITLLLFLIAGMLASLLINGVLLRFSRSLGIRNKNDVTVRWSNQSKPSLGGISMFVVFIFSIMALATLFPGISIFENGSFLSLLAGSSLAFVIGITDDAYNTKPLLKLLGQIACGLFIIYSGHNIDLFHVPLLDNIFTVLWVVIIMNSLNMLDNMDGITTTVSFFVLIACFVGFTFLYGLQLSFDSVLIVSLLGALLGFMYYNISPAKMFMGDTGSQFISFVVAFFSIESLWNFPNTYDLPSWSGFVLVLTIFTPAAVDTLSVVINRIKKGQSPMVGGKDHTTHHLVYKGLTDFGVWVVFLSLSVIAFTISLGVMFFIQQDKLLYTFIGVFYFIFVFFLLYKNTIKYKNPNE